MIDLSKPLSEEDLETNEAKEIFRDFFGIFLGKNRGIEEKVEQLKVIYETPVAVAEQPRVEVIESVVQVEKKGDFLSEPGNGESSRIEIIERPVIGRELNLHSITQYLQNNQVVGEEANGILATLSLANGIHVILEGDSGSGKSYLMKTVLGLFDGVYEIGLSSEQAIWRQADEINGSKILYVPELQKAVADKKNKVSGMIEFLKSLGEGKDPTRKVTNSDRTGVDTYRIEAEGKVFATTIATENDFKYDRELQRRFLILETDNSREHIDAIIRDKVSRRMIVGVGDDRASLEASLSERIEHIRRAENIHVINPFLGYLETTFPRVNKTQAYLDHYLNLFEAIGKFFSPDRRKLEVDDKSYVVLNLEDVFNGFQMYHPHFLRTLRSFNGDVEFNQEEPNWADCFRQGIYDIRLGEVGIRNGNQETLLREYPRIVDEWIYSQIEGSCIYTPDYKTGEVIEIADLAADKSRLLPAPTTY
ncbi:MAG: ABC transporter ATP-binding protein [archaeon]